MSIENTTMTGYQLERSGQAEMFHGILVNRLGSSWSKKRNDCDDFIQSVKLANNKKKHWTGRETDSVLRSLESCSKPLTGKHNR